MPFFIRLLIIIIYYYLKFVLLLSSFHPEADGNFSAVGRLITRALFAHIVLIIFRYDFYYSSYIRITIRTEIR